MLATASALGMWPGLVKNFFSSQDFMPHASCYMWRPWLIRLHLVSDVLITIAYYSIPITLVYFVRKRRDLPYPWMFLMFGAFIVGCGTTHLMEVITLFTPVYWISGTVKAFTAMLSVATAIAMIPLIPQAVALRGPAELEKINRQLVIANKELEAFSYSISHDLRTPLRAIDGFSRIVLQEHSHQIDAEGQKSLQRICAAAQRMGELIDDLLNLSHLSRQEMQIQEVDLAPMAENIAQDLTKNEPDRRVAFSIHPHIKVRGDPPLLRILLENLLGNAWKFTSKREHARIEFGILERNGQQICFIQDNGAGFDMAFQNQLFGAFHRLHTDKEFPGTGIGLATVFRIVHRHGGDIWAEGEVDKGATFYFTLSPAVRKGGQDVG
jgi:signal transduction histidine kinase